MLAALRAPNAIRPFSSYQGQEGAIHLQQAGRAVAKGVGAGLRVAGKTLSGVAAGLTMAAPVVLFPPVVGVKSVATKLFQSLHRGSLVKDVIGGWRNFENDCLEDSDSVAILPFALFFSLISPVVIHPAASVYGVGLSVFLGSRYGYLPALGKMGREMMKIYRDPDQLNYWFDPEVRRGYYGAFPKRPDDYFDNL